MAIFEIQSLAVIDGGLPSRALGLTVEWASARRGELLALWIRARALEPLERLDPLD